MQSNLKLTEWNFVFSGFSGKTLLCCSIDDSLNSTLKEIKEPEIE
jgi:hypothetical protein